MADRQMDLETWLLESAHVERNYKREGTSSRAAAYAARYANGAFMAIRTAFLHGNYTADEVAAVTGINFLTTRPRCSDLCNPEDNTGRPIPPFLVPTGAKRPNNSGKDANVLRLATPNERREWRLVKGSHLIQK